MALDRDDALHLDRVLRAKIGDEIGVLDGTGALAIARITELSKARALATIVSTEHPRTEPRVRVTIAQALPKTAEKLEWVLQHGVEAGATGFVVFRSARSEAGRLAQKPVRWERIIKTAAEQSARTRVPDVEFARDFEHAVEIGSHSALSLFCDEAERERSLRSAIENQTPSSVFVLVGPEGGWSDAERTAAVSAGALPITLGGRTLRTETSALVALSQILYALDAG